MYMRNVAVEEKYGVEIVPQELFYTEVSVRVADLIKANDPKSLDLVLNHITYSSNIVTAGNAIDWNTVPYVDVSDPWWPEFNQSDLTLNGKTFIAVNDLAISSISHTTCMYFNKELTGIYGLGDIYDIVDDGKWTYSQMLSFISDLRTDVNKDGRYDEDDLYGLRCGAYTSNTIWLWGFDNPVFSRNENTGELECTFYSNKIDRIASNLIQLYRRTDGVYYNSGASEMPAFVDGLAVFTWGSLSDMMTSLRTMSNWGIIPLPKYNSKQQEYHTMLGGGCNALVAPKLGGGETKLEKLGVIVTELTYRSNKDVRVKLYDKALKGKYADDVTEATMVDLIYDQRVVDFGYIYMGFDGPSFELQRMLEGNDAAVESSWNTRLPIYESKLEEVYAAFGLTFEGLR
jgi:hypothetical protein